MKNLREAKPRGFSCHWREQWFAVLSCSLFQVRHAVSATRTPQAGGSLRSWTASAQCGATASSVPGATTPSQLAVRIAIPIEFIGRGRERDREREREGELDTQDRIPNKWKELFRNKFVKSLSEAAEKYFRVHMRRYMKIPKKPANCH